MKTKLNFEVRITGKVFLQSQTKKDGVAFLEGWLRENLGKGKWKVKVNPIPKRNSPCILMSAGR